MRQIDGPAARGKAALAMVCPGMVFTWGVRIGAPLLARKGLYLTIIRKMGSEQTPQVPCKVLMDASRAVIDAYARPTLRFPPRCPCPALRTPLRRCLWRRGQRARTSPQACPDRGKHRAGPW